MKIIYWFHGKKAMRRIILKLKFILIYQSGFRSLPTYIYSFTSYLTRLNKETYKMFMYYGMFDAKAQYGGQDKFYAPLVELDEITDLMQWINAINEFHNMGAVTELIKIFDEHQEWNVNIRNDKYQKPETGV